MRGEEVIMPIIAIANQKGVISKTSTTGNLGRALARSGRHILVVDMDHQGAVTTAFGYIPDLLGSTIYEVCFRGVKTKEVILVPEQVSHIHILPANLSMTEVKLWLISEMGSAYFLKKRFAL